MSTSVVNLPGSLTCVGLGMMLGAHLGPRARAHIEQADVVFVLASDPLVELWLQDMNADVRSLQPYYAEGKPRHGTYREMVEAMLAEVRAGRRVCGAFYGHPGVFAKVPHDAITRARAEGHAASMEPGVSAEDCLYADLGIDPGRYGCQHYEASQLLFYRRRIDPSAYLVLWQVGVAGDRTYRRFATGAAHRHLLVERLLEDYPADHEVVIYEAATLPIMEPRIERVALRQLADAEVHLRSTVVLPPAQPMRQDEGMLARLAALERALEAGATASIRNIRDVPTPVEA
ncbi:MAG: SAM-dependent methyltransferase [Lysobacter sp.]|nr:SAM-dependent methyltransferase [Lysobacter sp.]